MQVEAARNIEVPHVISILCGGLDRQIEHHLFPRLPPNRLREISARVRAVCEAHGVRYLSKGWLGTLREVTAELWHLSSPQAVPLDAVA
jgi:linoleoyl-CoA desaturase